MKLVFLLLMMTFTFSNVYAADFCFTFPSGQSSRISDGVTQNGQRCDVGEARADCMRRLIIRHIKAQVRNWERDELQRTVSIPADVSVT